MRISDWSSDVCSSDLNAGDRRQAVHGLRQHEARWHGPGPLDLPDDHRGQWRADMDAGGRGWRHRVSLYPRQRDHGERAWQPESSCIRSEEHTSELQSLMRISYAVFYLKKKTNR